MRPEADVYSYVQDLEKHLQMTLFGGMADPEGAVLLVHGALADGDSLGGLAIENARVAAVPGTSTLTNCPAVKWMEPSYRSRPEQEKMAIVPRGPALAVQRVLDALDVRAHRQPVPVNRGRGTWPAGGSGPGGCPPGHAPPAGSRRGRRGSRGTPPAGRWPGTSQCR